MLGSIVSIIVSYCREPRVGSLHGLYTMLVMWFGKFMPRGSHSEGGSHRFAEGMSHISNDLHDKILELHEIVEEMKGLIDE